MKIKGKPGQIKDLTVNSLKTQTGIERGIKMNMHYRLMSIS
jgi:hypothetical protein